MVRVLKPDGLLIACLTRRLAPGMIVHLKWRTHWVTPAQVESWLLESGLENTQRLSFGDRAFCQRLSLAFVGRKPRLAGVRKDDKSTCEPAQKNKHDGLSKLSSLV